MAETLLNVTRSTSRRLSAIGPTESASKQKSRSSVDLQKSSSSASSIGESRYRPRLPLKTLYWRVPPKEISRRLENKRWHNLQLDLARLNQEENAVFFDNAGRSIEVKPIIEQEQALDFVLSRYVKYCLIANTLDDCYRYLVHPQKRLLLKACISAVFIRILELKSDLVDIDQREYHFFEDILQSYNCTPEEMELRVPQFIREERAQVLKGREKLLARLYDKHSKLHLAASKLDVKTMTKAEAILMIQRQTRYYLGVIKSEMAHLVLRPRSVEWRHAMQSFVINKWKVYATRKHVLLRKKELEQLLGMIPDESVSLKESVTKLISNRNRAKAIKNEQEFELDKVQVEKELFSKEGPELAWSLYYSIKQWLLEVRDVLGKFPPYPEIEEGGSLLLFSDKDIREVAEDLDINVVNGTITYPIPEKKVKEKKEKKAPKKSFWGPEGFEYTIEETDCMREMNARAMEYRDFWYFRDDSSNLDQIHDRELLKEQIRPTIAETIRLQVDELIRAELENLAYAIDREPKNNKGTKKKEKKEKKSQGKKKAEKDPTADKSMEELFEELVSIGIIKYNPKANLDDFVGDFSYSGAAMDQAKKDPMPSLADVRRMATEFAVLPLSSQSIHENAPLIRKLLIAGLRGTGKKLLLRAICHEAGAILFDLTPKNLEGKFDNPQGKKMLMHLILKVGKAMEPSIFWIGNCETMFLKKKDKTDTSKPHQWIKVLHKTLKKGLKNGDRMMLIGTSSMPGLTKQKKFNQFFDRIIIIPYPEYPSRYMAWKHFISQHLQTPVPPYFDLSSLTKVTTGFTIAAIKETCEDVLTDERKAKFSYNPLQPSDMINVIWRLDPIYQEEHEQFMAWYKNTPLALLRQQGMQEEENETPNQQKKK